MTTWLFVCGISLDLAGAALVAWTINRRTPTETREEALTRFDGNLWVVAFRLREQAYVRAGLTLLAAGFVLQLLGYMARLSWSSRALAVGVTVGVFATALAVASTFANRLVPVRYAIATDLPEGIQDERHAYNVRDLDAVQWWRRNWVERMMALKVVRSPDVVALFINHGRWQFECLTCRANGDTSINIATPELPTAVCLSCGSEFETALPDDVDELEQLLLVRPILNRNWRPDDSIAEIRSENVAHGFPVCTRDAKA